MEVILFTIRLISVSFWHQGLLWVLDSSVDMFNTETLPTYILMADWGYYILMITIKIALSNLLLKIFNLIKFAILSYISGWEKWTQKLTFFTSFPLCNDLDLWQRKTYVGQCLEIIKCHKCAKSKDSRLIQFWENTNN